MRAWGLVLAPVLIMFMLVGLGLTVFSSFWLGIWTSTKDPSPSSTYQFLGIYSALGLGSVLCAFITSLLSAKSLVHAGQVMHDAMLGVVVRAPVSFFDVTPVGRIVNRFSKDVGTIDMQVGRVILFVFQACLGLLGAVAAIAVATEGFFLIILVPCAYLYYLTWRKIFHSSVEVQRIMSINNSPVFANFGEMLSGVRWASARMTALSVGGA